MKNLISKAALLLLCSVVTLSSCKKDDSANKKTVTVKYQLMVSADINYAAGSNGSGIDELYLYANKEMAIVSAAYDKGTWTIKETAETEEAAIAACDKKATAIFDQNLSAINAACAAIKAKFDAKKATLLSKITTESDKTHVIYSKYGGHLYRWKADELIPEVTVKEGALFEFKAVGGEK